MIKISKKQTINGRLHFSTDNKREEFPAAFLEKNSRFRKLEPSYAPSKMTYLFKKMWHQIKPYFSIQKVSSERSTSIRPKVTKTSDANDFWKTSSKNLDVKLEHYYRFYRPYLEQDDDCPEFAIKAFKRLEKDTRLIKKLALKEPENPKISHFIERTQREIEQLSSRETRLLPLTQDGSLVISFTKSSTESGYDIQIAGTEIAMLNLGAKKISIAGKYKIVSRFNFNEVQEVNLKELLQALVQEESIDLNFLSAQMKKWESSQVPSTFEDLTTASNRADKLFWTILEGFAPKNAQNTNSHAVIRNLRLRTELLCLYEFFQQERFSLNPSNQEYRELKKLFQEVSRKVYIASKKGQLHTHALSQINKQLAIIDHSLQEAEKTPHKVLSGNFSGKSHAFKNKAVKGGFIKRNQTVPNPQAKINQRAPKAKPLNKITNQKIHPYGLEPYALINTADQFMSLLEGLHHSHLSSLQKEKTQAQQDFFRLFAEIPFDACFYKQHELINNDQSLWWALDKPALKKAMDYIMDMTESLAKERGPESLSQYEVRSFEKMIKIMTFLYYQRSGTGYKAITDSLQLHYWYPHQRRRYQQTAPHLVKPDADLPMSTEEKFVIPFTNKHFHLHEGTEDLAKEGLQEFRRYMIATQKIFGDTDGNYSLFGQTFFNILKYKGLFKKADRDKWMRPIENPYLIALFVKVIMDESEGRAELVANVPEAFHSNPEGLIEHYLNLMKKEEPGLKKPCFSPDTLSADIIKALSRMLRRIPHEEVIAFMHEYPDQMLNSEIRNFVDAIFFGSSLKMRKPDSNLLPQIDYQNQAQEEINRLEQVLKIEMQKANPDLELLKQQFDLYLYYHEFILKLKISLPDSPHLNLDQMIAFSLMQDKKRNFIFQDSRGVAARIVLRQQLDSGTINQNNLPVVLEYFAQVHGLPKDPKNIDPYFEKILGLHWEVIANHFEKDPLSARAYNHLIQHFLYHKKIGTDGGAFKHKRDLIFQNKEFEINLKTWELNPIGKKEVLCFLPVDIQSNIHIKAALPNQNLTHTLVFRQEVSGINVYSFKSPDGLCFRIEQDTNQPCRLYRLSMINGEEKWLQSAPILEEFSSSSSLSKIFKAKKPKPLQSFFANGLYIDPSRKHKGYVFNNEGTIDFEVKVQYTRAGLKIQSMTDCRTTPPTRSMQIACLSSFKDQSLDFLKEFEDPAETILWSRKGKLKKIELPRYNLSFEVEKGRLKCITEPHSGYFVNPIAREKDKQGIRFALLLTHPDPKKGKKLLIPDSKVINRIEKPLFPKAKGLAKLQLLNEFRKALKTGQEIGLTKLISEEKVNSRQYVNSVLKKVMPDLNFSIDLEVKSNERALSYTAFQIRGKTDEIIRGTKNWPQDLFQLIQHATLTDQPIAACDFLNKFPFKEAIKDPKLFNQIIHFCEQDSDASLSECAIKFKIAMSLFKALEAENKLIASLKDRLQGIIMQKGIEQLAFGRRIPEILQFKADEKMQLGTLLKEKNLPFFNAHMAIYFLKTGKSFDLEKGIEIKDTTWNHEVRKWKKELKEESYDNRIKKLESKIKVDTPLTEDQMKASLPLLHKNRPTLLFTPKEMEKLFHSEDIELKELKLDLSKANLSCEKTGLAKFQKDLDRYQRQPRKTHLLKANNKTLNRFIKNEVIPKQMAHENEMLRLENKIQNRLKQDSNQEKQTAIYAGDIRPPSIDELRLAIVQDLLESLPNLPSDVNLKELKSDLIEYFDAFAKKNAADSALFLLEEMTTKQALDPAQKEIYSNALYKLLTQERIYDERKDPRLLIFEAQMYMNFRKLEGGVNQLELLEALLQNPNSIIQAPTGAGKTSVFSIVGSLAKANGKNLVIQKVLPPLFDQTLDQMDDALGGVLGSLVFPLRFDLKMRLTKKEILIVNQKEEIHEVSIFKGMYEELTSVASLRGCVLTDYSSFPLIEEKFFKLGADMYEETLKGQPISEISREHYIYLRKILLLLGNKAVENMDEFDIQNRPIQKLQLSFGPGSDIPDFLFDASLEIYKILSEDKTLQLKRNIQGDLTEEMRKKILARTAKMMAKKMAEELGDPLLELDLQDYFLGKNENILKRLPKTASASFLDRIALYKDQLSIYLPLTLSHNRGSRYTRSSDGSKTIPCRSGEKREGSKPGTLLEDINYTIQDYLQGGITIYDLNLWRQDFENDFQTNPAIQKHFTQTFLRTPEQLRALFKSKDEMDRLINEINQDPHRVIPFLELRLKRMKASGPVISMDPGNCIDMSRAISGISATSGAKESLHSQFKPDEKANGQVRAEMAYRIVKRAKNPNVILYEPKNPEKIFEKADPEVRAFIDGADAFKNDPKKAATILLKNNPQLKGIEYRNDQGIREWVGIPTRKLDEKGYVFAEAETVGTDRPLAQNAKAVLTLNEKHGMGDYAQKEGRLRQPGQTTELAMSHYLGIKTVSEAMSHAICVDARTEAADIYRRKRQELSGIVRKEMKEKLLACEAPEDFLKIFQHEECRKLFITPAVATYQNPGEYFAARKHIEVKNSTPEIELNALKAKCRMTAEKLGLENAIKQLDKIQYEKKLLEKMLPNVNGSSQELEMEIKMEEDLELEKQSELTLELQNEMRIEEIHAAYRTEVLYPLRYAYYLPDDIAKHLKHLENVPNYIPQEPFSLSEQKSSYSNTIYLTDNFLPISRNKTSSIYKRKLFDSSMYRVGEVGYRIEKSGNAIWIINDPLSIYRPHFEFVYDIRTNKFTTFKDPLIKPPDFDRIIAQIKFFDGRTSGYTSEEVKELKEWLKAEGPNKMKNHLLKEVLAFRFKARLRFLGSQLQQIFFELNRNRL